MNQATEKTVVSNQLEGQACPPAPHRSAESVLGHAPKPATSTEASSPATISSTVRRGLHTHREHLADAILFEAVSGDGSFIGAFEDSINELRACVNEGKMKLVNEKIDGCMSIVFGFDNKGGPFVAYKGGFARSSQILLRSLRDLQIHYPEPRPGEAESGARKTLKACIEHLLPVLKDLKKQGVSDLMWQADVLFCEGDGRCGKSQTGGRNQLLIQANQVRYTVPDDNALYRSLASARLALAVHTIGICDPATTPGRTKIAVLSDSAKLCDSVSLLNRSGVCAIHPFRDEVVLPPCEDWEDRKKACDLLMKSIRLRLKLLGPAFHEDWAKIHLRMAQVFFNSFLRPPNDGGVYKLAAEGSSLNVAKLMNEYEEFCTQRLQKEKAASCAVQARFHESLLTHRLELSTLFEAYFEANTIIYKLLPALMPAMQSKLGGDDSEGIMLEQGEFVFKLVDRLGFTMRNNAAWDRRSFQEEPLPEPLDVWRPDEAFFICGWRVPHKGHVSALREVLRDKSIKRLHVIASPASSPRLDARSVSTLHAADTKKAIAGRDYRCVLSSDLRAKLGRLAVASLDDSRVDFQMLSPSFFWDYMRRAQSSGETGTVRFIIGEKELGSRRYDQQLNDYREQLAPLVIPMQEGGLSASEVRAALKEYALSRSKESLTKLHEAMSFVEDLSLREECIHEMVQEWRATDKRAQRLLEKEIAERKTRASVKRAS